MKNTQTSERRAITWDPLSCEWTHLPFPFGDEGFQVPCVDFNSVFSSMVILNTFTTGLCSKISFTQSR